MSGDGRAEGVGFGVCLEALEGFGERDRGLEQCRVCCYLFGGGVRWVGLDVVRGSVGWDEMVQR